MKRKERISVLRLATEKLFLEGLRFLKAAVLAKAEPRSTRVKEGK